MHSESTSVVSVRSSKVSNSLKTRKAVASVFAAVAMMESAVKVQATTVTSTWNGSTSANWSNAANWNPSTNYPGNGNGGISDFDVVIPAETTQPTLDVTSTIDTFTLNNSATLSIAGNIGLTVNSASNVDNGKLIVNSNNSYPSGVDFVGGALSGTGSILLNASGSSAQVQGILTLGSGTSITGQGETTATLTNQGIVNANIATGTMDINGNVTNSSTLEATAGGIMEFNGVTITNNTGGDIVASNGTVELNGASITGGTLSTASGGVVANVNNTSTLTNVTNAGTFYIYGNTSVNVSGNLVDNGTIALNQNASYGSSLGFNGGTLSGTGTLSLDNSGNSAIVTGTLAQSSGHTINGFGEIAANLTNSGLVNASAATNTLFVSGSIVINTSTMEATTGVLDFNNGVSVTNTGGTILASASDVVLDTATVTSGTIKSLGSNAILTNNATISNVTIPANSTVDIEGNSNLTVLGSTLTNNGNITLNYNQFYSSALQINSNVFLTGSGSLTLADTGSNAIITTGTGDTLTQDVNHTINGYGQIAASFVNNGTVDANTTASILTLLTSNMTNNKTMEANGGTLEVSGITLTQSTSAVLKAIGTLVEIDGGATVSGGTLTTSSGGLIEVTNGSTDTLASVTNTGTLLIMGNNSVNVTGNLVDNGTITLNPNQFYGSGINFSGGTLSGTGTLTLDDTGSNAIVTGTVTQSSGHTINGYGEINATFTNNGVVNTNVANQVLDIDTSMINTSTLEATGGGTLNLTNGITVTNTSASIIANNATVELTTASITGGTLSTPNGGVIETISGNTDGLTSVTNNGTLDILGNSSVNVTGNLVDNGLIAVNPNQFYSSGLAFSGGTLSGTGTLSLESGGSNAIVTGTVTQASGHTINGFGEISATFTNNGIVTANSSGNTLLITGVVTNNSTLQATTGVLYFSGGSVLNTTGSILANNGTVYLNSETITGGTLGTSSSGVIQVPDSTSGTVLAGVTNTGTFNIGGNSNVSTTGTTKNNGTITVNDDNFYSSNLSVGGPITGTGTLAIDQSGSVAFAANIGASTMGALKISGNGQLDLNNNHLFINYSSSPDPIASIAALIKSGYNGGAWNGSGIDSSAAASNNSVAGNLLYGVGYADSADPGNPAGLSSGQIEIKYTLLGDANLSGVVDGVDFGIVAANFNKGVTGWDKGDFNYDNTVDGTDFGDLAANFNQGANGAAVGPGALSDPALVAFAQANGLMADVPEPASLGLTLVASGFLAARRRRRR